MFRSNISGIRQPPGDYPRIGPTWCTKWFGPSIIPGPIYPSWTTTNKQQCSIDSGGNIFLQNDDLSTGDPAGAATEEAFAGTHPSPGGRRSDEPAVAGPVEGQREHHQLSDMQQDSSSAGNSHGRRTYSQPDALSSSTTTTINCGGTLQHVGGILRCRSASADPLSWASGGYCDEGGDTRHPSMESISRPTLRAYSTP
ncbi:unnamed protein product, partial [Ectocarpus sp. 13 AM-2016]